MLHEPNWFAIERISPALAALPVGIEPPNDVCRTTPSADETLLLWRQPIGIPPSRRAARE
jgi:hypothetical protein